MTENRNASVMSLRPSHAPSAAPSAGPRAALLSSGESRLVVPICSSPVVPGRLAAAACKAVGELRLRQTSDANTDAVFDSNENVNDRLTV